MNLNEAVLKKLLEDSEKRIIDSLKVYIDSCCKEILDTLTEGDNSVFGRLTHAKKEVIENLTPIHNNVSSSQIIIHQMKNKIDESAGFQVQDKHALPTSHRCFKVLRNLILSSMTKEVNIRDHEISDIKNELVESLLCTQEVQENLIIQALKITVPELSQLPGNHNMISSYLASNSKQADKVFTRTKYEVTELFKKELLKEIANVAELEDNLNFSLADFQEDSNKKFQMKEGQGGEMKNLNHIISDMGQFENSERLLRIQAKVISAFSSHGSTTDQCCWILRCRLWIITKQMLKGLPFPSNPLEQMTLLQNAIKFYQENHLQVTRSSQLTGSLPVRSTSRVRSGRKRSAAIFDHDSENDD